MELKRDFFVGGPPVFDECLPGEPGLVDGQMEDILIFFHLYEKGLDVHALASELMIERLAEGKHEGLATAVDPV